MKIYCHTMFLLLDKIHRMVVRSCRQPDKTVSFQDRFPLGIKLFRMGTYQVSLLFVIILCSANV